MKDPMDTRKERIETEMIERAEAKASANLRTCVFSADRLFRYTLWREWPAPEPNLYYTADPHLAYYPGKHHEFLMVVGLNPSTADETKDDPTIRRCIGFAKAWGFGALCMTNLFAYRATDPRKMMGYSNPIGAENDRWLTAIAREASLVIAAWGTKGEFLGRDSEVLKLLDNLHCFRITTDGFPEHPLYMPADTMPIPFNP